MSACLIDTSAWVAVSFAAHPCHLRARQALLDATGDVPWLWCRATQQSFLRLASTPALLNAYGAAKATNHDAFRALEALMSLQQVAFVDEPPGVMTLWARLACIEQAAPKCWMDAYLAAFALSGGWRLVSLDRDFLRYTSEGLDLQLLQPNTTPYP